MLLAKYNDVRKTSYLGFIFIFVAQTRPNGAPTIQLSSKWPNLQGRLELILRSIFAGLTFILCVSSFLRYDQFCIFFAGLAKI